MLCTSSVPSVERQGRAEGRGPGDGASRRADPRRGGGRGGGGARTEPRSPAVLVRYQREDGRVHAVNLQQAGLADGRTHTALLRLRGPARPSPALQLYVDCKLGDQHAGLPALAPIPPAEVDGLEIRTGQKAYLRMQVSRRRAPWGFWGSVCPGGSSGSALPPRSAPAQGFVESMKMILGGSMARVGALSECPFQGDESIHSAGDTETSLSRHPRPHKASWGLW